MRYMLMLYADEKAGSRIPPDLMAKVMDTMSAYGQALQKAGVFVATAGLARTSEAKTLRMRGGEMRVNSAARQGTDDLVFSVEGGELEVLDGPYADTREQFGGYFVIEVADLDEAVAWASRCPAAQWGPIEIRPYNPGY